MKNKINVLLCIAVASVSVSVQSAFGQSDRTTQQIFSGFHQFADGFKVNEDGADGSKSGITPLTMGCIRQKGNREFPYPVKGHEVITNPPVFTWPMADYKYPEVFPVDKTKRKMDDCLHYDFQLGRTRDFSDKDVLTRTGLKLAFYNNHKPLKPGTWYWRYRVSGKSWSKVYEVNIPENIPEFQSPEAEEAYAMIPEKHPRIFGKVTTGRPLTTDQKKLRAAYRRAADIALDKAVADYKVKGEPIPATTSEVERSQIMKFRLRYEVERINSDIEHLLNFYRFTSDRKYLEKAVALSDYIAAKEPAEMYAAADFTGAKSMSTLSMTYDVAYAYLSEIQKKNYKRFITTVIALIIDDAMLENVGSADGILCAHFFQHTFYNAFTSAIVLKGHDAQAEKWFGMLYDIWLSRSPGGGFLSDGVWPNGNIGYIHVNMESMVNNFVLYRDLFNVNIFMHPWYANCANALAYTIPLRSVGDGFGDGNANVYEVNRLRAEFAYILGQELNNPFAIHYAYELSGQSPDAPFAFKKTDFGTYRLQHQPQEVGAVNLANIPQSAVFPQTGIVVMNTDVLNAADNLFVSFRSSPFGVGSHGMAEQNSFNVSYKGKPIFYPTGYKVTTSDKHYLLAHKHSRARNTITVDGKTQAYSHSGYGWIARYLDGNDITYALGDASNAYVPFDQSALNWTTVLKNAQAYTSENGFILDDNDNPQVRKFRRHLVMLRPNIIVVYDELEAEKEVTWTFQLNGLERAGMKILEAENSLIADTDNCDALARIFGSSELTASLVDTSYVKPFDWLNPQRGRKAIAFEKKQYHGKFENVRKCKDMRFLAVIQIDESNSMSFADVKPDADNTLTIGNYRIKAQMDTRQEARLEIENKATGEYLLYGPANGTVKAKERKFSHSTLLINKTSGCQEAIDRYPLMVPCQKGY